MTWGNAKHFPSLSENIFFSDFLTGLIRQPIENPINQLKSVEKYYNDYSFGTGDTCGVDVDFGNHKNISFMNITLTVFHCMLKTISSSGC